MATITFKGNHIQTQGSLPEVGSKMHSFELVATDLSVKKLEDFTGKRLVLNIFPSIDTGICAMSVRVFNEKVASLDNTVVLCISKDLPFAMSRFCGAEGINNVVTLSGFRSQDFGYLEMIDGPLQGLMSRVVMVLDAEHRIIYAEQVPEIAQEPDYDAAIRVL